MRSPKQTQASRINGARSKGPVTAIGKYHSSQNAIRHGILAETVVLDDESKDNFIELLDDLTAHHDPQNITEYLLIQTMAVSRFRQFRIWEMQRVAFNHDVDTPNVAAETPCQHATLALRGPSEIRLSHELLLRYEVALDRMFSRALRRLDELKSKNSPTEKGTQENTENKPSASEPKREPVVRQPPKAIVQQQKPAPPPSPKSEAPARRGNSPQNNPERPREHRERDGEQG